MSSVVLATEHTEHPKVDLQSGGADRTEEISVLSPRGD